jgi:predicted O-linked N-acetylglucosamine transferase (SPINDLY family)
MAVQIGGSPQLLAAIKEKLARNRFDSPLFDTARFVKHLEIGYARMLERFHAGLPPEHIQVPP